MGAPGPDPSAADDASAAPEVVPLVLLLAARERARSAIRAAFPRRRGRVVAVRSAEELAATLRSSLTDAVVVDVAAPGADTERAVALAREFPSVPFVGMAPLRASDGPALAAAAGHDFADVVVDTVDDGVLRAIIAPLLFSARFAAALWPPPPSLALAAPLQQSAWRCVVARGGRPVRTTELARALGVTREHLSRSFAAAGAPNLKRVIDLVRLLAAAELAKNPGYDVRDVARVLGFASASHLSSTAQRVVGTKPASLARLRAVDLVERFGQGRGRSRRMG
jgi:AraC-like DNA-binding protein